MTLANLSGQCFACAVFAMHQRQPRLRLEVVVPGQQGLLVPDIAQVNTFLIQVATPGQESAYCAMTQTPLNGKVNDTWIAAKLEPLKDVSDMAAIRQGLEATGAVVGSGSYNWTVKPVQGAESGS